MTKFYDISRLCIRLYYILDQKNLCSISLGLALIPSRAESAPPPVAQGYHTKNLGTLSLKILGILSLASKLSIHSHFN